MISGGVETLIVSGVLDIDHFTLGGDVRVLSLLDENSTGQSLALVADVSVLSGQDVVSSLVLGLVAAVIALLFVVLQDRDPGGGLLGLLELSLVLLLLVLLRLGLGFGLNCGGNGCWGSLRLLVLLVLLLLLLLLLGLLAGLLLLVVLLLLELTLRVNAGRGCQEAQGDLKREEEDVT